MESYGDSDSKRSPLQYKRPGFNKWVRKIHWRREWQGIFKVLKQKTLQTRLLYLERISFNIDGEIKSFPGKQKLREFSTTKPALQQMLKRLTQSRNTRRKQIYKIKPQTIKKMEIGTYISIITLNVNGLNVPTKRHRLAEWIQKQDPYIC